MDRYLDVLGVEDTTRGTYESYIRRYVRPALGELQVGRIAAEVLDSLYAQLRRCRRRCGRRQQIDHRTTADHDCDERCRQHVCRPLAAATIRQIHWILSGAFDRAVRWRWISATSSRRRPGTRRLPPHAGKPAC
jgi:integrase